MSIYKNLTDEELSEKADNAWRGHGAIVESTTRLRKSIEKLDKTTSFYSRTLIILTVALLIVALIQIKVVIGTPP